MPLSVGQARALLLSASARLQQLMSDDALERLEEAAELFAEAKAHARDRRDRWKERKGGKVAFDLPQRCRVKNCPNVASHHPILLFPAMDGGAEPIRAEMAMLDVCEPHSRTIGPDCYLENPYIWDALCDLWESQGFEAPDPKEGKLIYEPLRKVEKG